MDGIHLELGLKAVARATVLASLERERKRAQILAEVCLLRCLLKHGLLLGVLGIAHGLLNEGP